MALASVLAKSLVLHPDETVRFVHACLELELLREAAHDARVEREPIAVLADALLALVRLPQVLGRARQEVVHVLGEGQAFRRADGLEHAASLCLARPVGRHPGHLDEEVFAEQVAEPALPLCDTTRDATEVAERITNG